MGRTNPTYRQLIRDFEEEWEPFRRASRRQYQEGFDRLIEHADAMAMPGGAQASPDPRWPIVMSILVRQELAIMELEARVES